MLTEERYFPKRRTKMRRFLQFVFALIAVVWAARDVAEDAYYCIPLDKLELTEGKLPKGEKEFDWRNLDLWEYMRSYAVLDGEGEVYVQDETPWGYAIRLEGRGNESERQIAVRTSADRDVPGRLFAPKSDWTGYEIVKFKIPASAADKDARTKFLQIKIAHYQQLLNRNIAGGAWFRHQVRQSQNALGQKPREEQVFPSPISG